VKSLRFSAQMLRTLIAIGAIEAGFGGKAARWSDLAPRNDVAYLIGNVKEVPLAAA
jgi:hypothetical protein